jgi:hypothetical protein
MAMVDASTLVDVIQAAFSGVKLGRGISLRQSEVIDRYGKDCTHSEFKRMPLSEITDDWRLIPWGELDRLAVAHLDAEGLRYYLPALMLSVLKDYDACSMRVIGVLHALYPKSEHWDYCVNRYGALSGVQNQAIATFLVNLPALVALEVDDQIKVERAVRNYWRQFL